MERLWRFGGQSLADKDRQNLGKNEAGSYSRHLVKGYREVAGHRETESSWGHWSLVVQEARAGMNTSSRNEVKEEEEATWIWALYTVYTNLRLGWERRGKGWWGKLGQGELKSREEILFLNS